MKPLKHCVNDTKPVQAPSKVLCADCLKELSKKFDALLKTLDESKRVRSS